jgi:DNA-binding CsgD family transcriptional regulator
MKSSFTRTLLPGSLLIVFFIAACSLQGQAQDYFLSLKNAAKQDQYNIACKIYYQQLAKLEVNYQHIKNLDTTAVANALRQLETLADKENNKELRIIFLAFMGDFYARYDRGGEALRYLNGALPRAVEYNLKELVADIYANVGWTYYYSNHDYKQGFEYMLKAKSFIENETGGQNFLSSGRVLYKLGFMYYDFRNVSKARSCLYKSLSYPVYSDLSLVGIYNTIALTYRDDNMMDSATAYFIKAAAIAEANNFQAWIGITKGNLGLNYYKQDRLEEAKPLLQTDLTLSIENREWGSAANSLCLFADMSIRDHDLNKANRELDSALMFSRRQSSIGTFYRYYTTKAKLCKEQRNYAEAYTYIDSSKILQDSITKKNNSVVYARIEENIQMEKYLADKKLMEVENNRLVLVRNFITILLVLVVIIAVQFILRMHAKRKKEKQLMDVAKDQLAFYIENLRSKNELIDEFQKEIERLNELPGYMLQKEKDEMSAKLKEYTILTETHWNEFRHLFEKVHTGFFEKLKIRYGNLTQAEIRLLALLRLNLSKREIAEMLGISPDSVKKTRQRIHHKIELPENKQLEDIVLTI